MPAIPRYNRSVSIPGRVANPELEGEAAGSLGKDLAQVGTQATNLLARHVQKLQHQDNLNKQVLFQSQIDDDVRTFKMQEAQKQGSDSYKSLQRGQAFKQSLTEKYSKLADNPTVKSGISQYIIKTSDSLFDTLAVHEAQQRKKVSEQSSESALTGYVKDAYAGGDFKQLATKWLGILKAQHQVGLISGEDAVTKGTAGESSLASSYLEGLIDRDPTSAIEQIKKGAFDAYLPAKKVHAFHEKATAMEKAAKADLEKKNKEELASQKVALKQAQNKTGNDFLTANLDGTLTRKQVLSSNLDPTGTNGKATWIKRIEAREQKIKKTNAEWKTKPEILADFQTKITMDPKSVNPEDIMEAQGKGLSTSDAKSLVTYRNGLLNKADPQKTQTAKAAYTRLREAKTGKLFGGDKSENSKKWATAVNQLHTFIQNHPDEDPQDFIDELLEPVKDNFLRKWFSGFGIDYQTEEEKQKELNKDAGIKGKIEPYKSSKQTSKKGTVQVKIYKKADGSYNAVYPDGTTKPATKTDKGWKY